MDETGSEVESIENTTAASTPMGLVWAIVIGVMLAVGGATYAWSVRDIHSRLQMFDRANADINKEIVMLTEYRDVLQHGGKAAAIKYLAAHNK